MSVRSTVQRLEYKGDDHVYYDIAIRNTLQDRSIPAIFQNSNPSIILENPSDYYVAVAQFDLPNRGLPILDVQLPTGNPEEDANRNIYTIGINGFGYRQRLLQPGTGLSETIYSYQRLVSMVNEAIESMWPEVIADAAGEGIVVTPDDMPYLILDTQTKLASMIYPADNFPDLFNSGSYVTDLGDLAPITIVFYDRLYNLFSSLPVQRLPGETGISVNYLLAYVYGAASNVSEIGGNPYVVMTQEYSTLALWRQFLSLAFVGLGLPIKNEYYPAIANSYAESTDNTRNTNIQPVLFDFVPTVDTFGSFVYQEPTGQYRLVDLKDNMPLSRFSIQCQLRYPDNRFDNLQLFPGETARIKLVFIRKGAGSQTFKNLADGGQLQVMQQATSLAQQGLRLV